MGVDHEDQHIKKLHSTFCMDFAAALTTLIYSAPTKCYFIGHWNVSNLQRKETEKLRAQRGPLMELRTEKPAPNINTAEIHTWHTLCGQRGGRPDHSPGDAAATRPSSLLVLGKAQQTTPANMVICQGAARFALSRGECPPTVRVHAAMDARSINGHNNKSTSDVIRRVLQHSFRSSTGVDS